MPQTKSPLDEWKLYVAVVPHRPTILLCGAKQWDDSPVVDHRRHFPLGDWVTTDIEAGDGVDLVHDLQNMWQETDRKFDGIFCPAVLEHIQRPWTAVHSMAQMLLPGGVLYIQTHQTFPLHGYPNDHFRFSTDALETLCRDSGLDPVFSGYDGPCTITPGGDATRWNVVAEAWLNVTICAQKPRQPEPITESATLVSREADGWRVEYTEITAL